MALTNNQIDRYSRQIIVPGIGGVGQERILAARILIIADRGDAELVLAHLVGAGVGHITLRLTDADTDYVANTIARMRDLNADVIVTFASGDIVNDVSPNSSNDSTSGLSLIFALADSDDTLAQVRALCKKNWNAPWIFARLDTPEKIVIAPSRLPCPACASGDLLAPFGRRGDNAGFVAMLAATEALKALAQFPSSMRQPAIAEFNGYAASTHELAAPPHPCPACTTAGIT